MKIGSIYYLIEPLPVISFGPGYHKDCHTFNAVSFNTINGYVGKEAKLTGIEFSPVCTNYYFYFSNIDVTIILIDEFEDPCHFFVENIFNSPRIWRDINGCI